VTVLLAPDDVELYEPGGTDEHGWRLPGAVADWRGRGSLQLVSGLSDPRATDRGGHGPHDPRAAQTGTLFVPADARPRDGMTAVVRETVFVLSQVRLVPDPVGSGLDCYAATVTEAPHA
jgi:hypothetical protein